MKIIYTMIAVLIVICCAIIATRIDFRAALTKCQESVLGKETAIGRCDYPARIMRIKGVWVCSCRSEEETKKGIE